MGKTNFVYFGGLKKYYTKLLKIPNFLFGNCSNKRKVFANKKIKICEAPVIFECESSPQKSPISKIQNKCKITPPLCAVCLCVCVCVCVCVGVCVNCFNVWCMHMLRFPELSLVPQTKIPQLNLPNSNLTM